MKILIIGGYGAFGGRLARLLSDLPIDILIGGRRFKKATAFCNTIIHEPNCVASYRPMRVDRNHIIDTLLKETPDIVVDASGPFQLYGDDPYVVVKACLDIGCHYLDLADSAAFVTSISQFDGTARAKGVTLLSGLSTCPALSGAVLKHFQKNMTVTDISIGIAPSPYAGLGKSVIAAALSYAGGDIALTRNGQSSLVKGLTEYRRYTIAVPGHKPLRSRHFSLAEIPDLTVFPHDSPSIQTIWSGAGIKPELLHKGLNVLAHIRHWFRLPAMTGLTSMAQWALTTFRQGEHRGGMYVDLKGQQDGQSVHKSWHLIAEGDDGPLIPAKACEAIIRKFCSCDTPEIGARPATDELTMGDFDDVFTRHNIAYGRRDHAPKPAAFSTVLGSAYKDLPDTVQALHAGQSSVWTGQAEVKGPANILGRVSAWLAGIKIKSGPQNVTFTLSCDGQTEVWERNFGGRVFKSTLKPGTGKNEHLMMERFGFISIAMALVIDQNKLRFIPRRWFALGIPLPNLFLPRGDTFEYEKDGKFHFDVNISAPIIGRIAAYKGWLSKQK